MTHGPLKAKPAADIAIIGMAGFFPQAADVGAYWHNIVAKRVAFTEIPAERWDWRLYYDADLSAPDKIVSRWGAFLPDIVFDPLQYGIPPNSLNYIESAQLLILESTRQALADAGYGERSFDRERTSVFIGTGAGEGDLGQMYSFRSMLPHYFGASAEGLIAGLKSAVPDWNPDAFTGVITNITAGRVANRFNLGGTNCTIDAACASALAALRAGVMELRAGESDLVIVGGADMLMSPFAFSCFSKVGALSPQGQCRAFDEKADGIVLGEVVASVILKRLADAQADGDRIYAVIKGIGASSDGRAKSLTAPSRDGQLLALKRAYTSAGVDPDSVGLIEAHGTGTQVGDQSEAEALSQFFSQSGMPAKSCAVGSVKSLIGHAKTAAGIASLIKTILALHHKVLPPTWGVENPIAEINGPNNPLYLNTQARPWISSDGRPRRAGVSAFGFGGTNFHVVLEEAQVPAAAQQGVPALADWESELLLFKAATRQALSDQIASLQRQILPTGSEAPVALKDLAYTLAERFTSRTEGGVGLALVVKSMAELGDKLAEAEKALSQQTPMPNGIYFHEGAPIDAGQIAFVFPGQGSQYAGMLRELGLVFESVRATVERFDRHLEMQLAKPLSRYIYPPDFFSAEERKYSERDLTQTYIAQPAMGAVDVAMNALLTELGIQPAMCAGHSYGEYAALHAAGVLDEQALALISEARGRFIIEASQPEPGTMAAVKAPEKDVAAAIEGLEQVWIANLNAPLQTVISGTQAGVRAAIQKLGERGISSVPIAVACAFHSPIVGGAQARLKDFFGQFKFQPARRPVFSNTSAALFPAGVAEIQALLAEQLLRPVRFVDEIEAMYAAGARLFIEVGAGNVLTNLIGRILEQRPHYAVCTDIKGRPALTQLLHALAQLAVLGVAFNPARLFAQRHCRQVDLESLSAQSAAPLPKTAFLIGQKGVRPAGHISRWPAGPTRPVCFADEARPASVLFCETDPLPRETNQLPLNGEPMENTKPSSNVSHSAVDANVMARFQDLMSQFLETQRAVMTAYLNGAQIDSPAMNLANLNVQPGLPQAAALQSGVTQAAMPSVDIPRTEPAPAAALEPAPTAQPEVTPAQRGIDVAGLLIGIVSDRTGYPAEMLDLKLEIEADLGIDSIKRVQITETLVTALEAQGISLPTDDLAAIASSVSLGEIITKLQGLINQAAASPQAAQPAVSAPAATGFDVTAALVGIVSERTGYPAEMLDLNLQIESELGIDSIKRVQITESLVAALEAQGITLPTDDLAAIASSATLGEIIAKLNGLIGRSAPAAAANEPVAAASAPMVSAADEPQIPAEPPAQAVGTLLSSEQLQALLFNLVEQHTGFPKETLLPELEWSLLDLDTEGRRQLLEAFAAAVARKVGAAPMIDASQGTAALRLADTLAWMAATSLAGPDPVQAAGTRAIRRFILTSREQPLLPTGQMAWVDKTILVTQMPDDSLAEGVMARLRSLQARPVRLVHRPTGQAGADNEFAADLTAADQVEAIVAQIRTQHGPIAGLLHLAPLSAAIPFESMNLSQWRQRLALEVKSLFYLTKHLSGDLTAAIEAGRAGVVAVTAMGAAFGSLTDASADPGTQSPFFPGSGAITGFLKTVALENPGLNVRALDLDPTAAEETRILQIADEWRTACADVEVAYVNGRRLILDAVPAPVDASQPPAMAMDSNWRVLITGGARGITATIALELARRFQPTLLLVGRTPLTAAEDPETAGIEDHKQLKAILTQRLKAGQAKVKPMDVERAYTRLIRQREVRQTLAQLQAAGSQVRYFEADVTDEASLGAVLDTIYQEYGHIDGVLHGAGLIEDKLVRDKEIHSFARVFDTKADSLFILSRKLRADSLRFLALFSSVAGRFGNVGQADYAAANEVYTKSALALNRRWPGRVAALMWGPWESQGMVSAELRQKFEAMGVSLIAPQVGVRCFLDEISHGAASQAEVIFGGWDDRKRAVTPAKKAEQLPLFFINANFKPLLDGNVEVVRRLELERDIYLDHHRLDGLPVLPMAMAMELMAEAAAYRYPDLHLKAVSDLKVYRGIILKNGHELVRIAATPLIKSEDHVALKVVIRDPDKEGRLFYEARVEMGRDPVVFRPHVGLDLTEPAPFAITLADAYRQYMFHGPLWQGVEEIQAMGKDGIIGRLRGCAPKSFMQGAPDQARWLIDPLIIDGGLQLVGFWLRTQLNTTALPSQLKKYTQYCPAPQSGTLRCEVRFTAPDNKGIKLADLYFVKPDHRLFAMIRGLEIIDNPALNRLSEK